jgi:hypothetical protein
VLATIPGREALRTRIAELADATSSVSRVARVRGRLFYLKSELGHDQRRLFVRDEAAGAERPRLDPLEVPDELGSPGFQAPWREQALAGPQAHMK